MANFCNNCGAKTNAAMKFCVECGAKYAGDPSGQATQAQPSPIFPAQPVYVSAQAAPAYPAQTSPITPAQPVYQNVQQGAAGIAATNNNDNAGIDQADIDANKMMGGLAYFICFLPLIVCPGSRYARYHANQGLALLIFIVSGTIVMQFIPFLLGIIINPVFAIMSIVFFIKGIVHGFGGTVKRLPLIGKITIIK